MGMQESEPPTECWETAMFNDSTCLWVVTGMQDNEPPTQCWETAMFNDSTCLWVVTGMQENEPITECWETATFNDSTCVWVVMGMQESEPPTECWETATFNDSTCVWVVTGMQESEPPVVNCWDDFVFYTTTCMWGNIGTQEPEPPVVNCWDDFVFNSTTCMWDNTGTIPLCDDDNCATNDSYDTTACECIFTPNPLVGCTDTNACNYDSTATCDDGSCEYGEVGCTNPCDALLGCTNTTACNYNSLATCDDGSCISMPCNLGCTDPCAPNYDELADADDGSCEEYTTTCNTDCTIGNIEGWDSASCSCVIILETIYGCTDYDACNFDSDATCNDDSCDYGVEGCPIPCNAVLGCTNAAACNFNPLATCSDDSCILPDGCTDQSACNYDATALCDNGSCNYGSENCDNPCDAILGCTDENACNYNNYATCNDGSCILPDGCTNSLACNYDPTALCDNGNCDYGEINCDDPCSAILGCTDENACNYDSTANCDDDSCISAPCNAGCTDPCASNYNPLTDADDGSCETYDTTCNTDCSNGDIEVWDAINCGCVVSIVTVNGCTDETACNYDAVANCSDGSCEYDYVDCDNPCNAILGCTDENACNYNPMANCDDDSCILETACDADACTNGGAYIWDDATCDCVLDEVTISGCTDENACNYNPMATCDDDSCISAPCNAGCTDPCATNYDPLADADDGSCEPYDTTCNTNCALGAIEIWSPELCACIVSVVTINGCTDEMACNYDALANCNDGSCEYGDIGCDNPCNTILGCTDENACNYNPMATCDDDSCMSAPCNAGCTDPCAANYDELADGDDGSCEAYDTTCNTDCSNGDIEVWDAENCGCVVSVTTINGCTDEMACNYDAHANCEDNTCDYGEINCDNPCYDIIGCTDENACNYNPMANCDNGSCVSAPCNAGCTDPCAANYDELADGDDGSCEAYDTTCNTDCALGAIEVWNPELCACIVSVVTINGCTDEMACNYDALANCNDGSCEYGDIGCDNPCSAILGCTDENACNYNPMATCDDDSCMSAPCNAGCTDPCAANYDELADGDDGSCIAYDITCDNQCELTEGIYDYDLCDCVYTPIVCDDNDDCTNDYFSEGFCACVYEEVCGLITGAVFLDENENDLMDGNDGVIGISVYLYDESDNLMAQTVTDSNGEYSFTQIVAGNYYVSFNIPSNYTIVTPNIGNNNEIDSDINSNGTTPLFSLSQGQTITGINAGIIDEVIDCDNFAVSVDVICYDENYEIIIAFIGGATNEYTVFNVQTGTIVNTTEEFLALGPFDFNTGYHYNVSLTNNSLCMSSFMQATIDCISTSVELLDFIGSVEETGNLLKWATASEENNDYFKLMRSTDGINFEEINRQDGAGNSQITLLYEYLDQTAPLGISYYRLDQVDWDGTETSSDIIALERTNQDLSSIHVWPNPATNILNIQYNSTNELPTQLFVYNTQGQLIKSITQESIEGVNNITLNTEAFAAGLYFVEVQTSGTNIQLITFIRK